MGMEGRVMRYEEEGRKLIREAGVRAREMGHSYVGSGHLLMALAAQTGAAGRLLRQAGAEPGWLEEVAAAMWGRGKSMPLAQGFTGAARSILRGAAREAGWCNCREVKPIHILLAVTRRGRCHAAQMLALCGIDPAAIARAELPLDTPLPWAHISTGVTMAYLRLERERAARGITTPDCSFESCTGCGACMALDSAVVTRDVRVSSAYAGGESHE